MRSFQLAGKQAVNWQRLKSTVGSQQLSVGSRRGKGLVTTYKNQDSDLLFLVCFSAMGHSDYFDDQDSEKTS